MKRAAHYALITGGAGFIGTNLAARLLSNDRNVLILDNLSRPGVETNLAWLQSRYPERLRVLKGDVRDAAIVAEAVAQASEIYHLAAQVAVTTSLRDPIEDFEINTRGTLNVLEAARSRRRPPSVLYTSTNKVYGALEDVELTRDALRYEPADEHLLTHGVDERRPLDFHSPYGCSKGAAEQYVLDYARCYGLRTVVFRMSCIYGPHQQGNEDQGWVAHFMISARDRRPLAIYGDGRQIRDILFVDDLVDAFLLATQHASPLRGQVFNIGGGPANTLSLLELINYLSERQSDPVHANHAAARTGDQRYYVSDTRKFTDATTWRARVSATQGLQRLHEFVHTGAHEHPALSDVAVAVSG